MTMAGTRVASPVSWFEVHTPDTARAQAVFGELFGWTFSEAAPDYTFVGLGDDAPIGGGIAPPIDGQPPMAIICVQVADVAETCAKIEELGGKVLTAPQQTPDGLTFAYVSDPDFGVLGVWKPPAAA
jgi:predicted enzyme related to lactoylglutathione lyase